MIFPWLFPFVSGMNRIINTVHNRHSPAITYNATWNPSFSTNDDENLPFKNSNSHKSAMQSDTQASFILSGIISTTNTNDTGTMPNVVAKADQLKLMTGIQLSVSSSECNGFSITYTPNTIKPNAVPTDDTTSKI